MLLMNMIHIIYQSGTTRDQVSSYISNPCADRPDLRAMEEIHWYGWFIDYWMEGGLMRDIYTTRFTTEEHWNMLIQLTVTEK